LPIKITDSEEESVDVSEDYNETSCEVKVVSLSGSSADNITSKNQYTMVTTGIMLSTDNSYMSTTTSTTTLSESFEKANSARGAAWKKEKQKYGFMKFL